jgi:large subunit ribosomal protein L9
MNVILLEKIENLGDIGDQVKVRSGYGRNFLLPQGKAALATADNVAKMEARRAELEGKAAAELDAAKERAKQFEGFALTMPAKAGSEGKLFGSIGTADIAEACEKAGVPVEKREVRMADGPIRIAGEHEIEIHLHSDVSVIVPINVVAEE